MKKITKILTCILICAMFLTGCATVSSINNSSSEIVYNGNSAVMVDGYLYYGNSFADYTAFESEDDYKSSAKNSYLARLNTKEYSAKDHDYSPKNIETVTEEVVGQANNFTFVLGNYIYYATPNTQKAKNENGDSAHYFNYTTLYRSKLDGDNKQKIYTTNGEVSQIETLKSDGKYYIVMLVGEDLIKIEIGNDVQKEVVLASGVTSVAMPKTYQQDKAGSSLEWNDYIYYTTAKSDEDNSDVSGTIINRVKLSQNSGEKMDAFSETITFVGRDKDIVFYSKSGTETEIYKLDVTTNTLKSIFRNGELNTLFYTSSSISNINILVSKAGVEYGYAFLTSSSKLAVVSKNGTVRTVVTLNANGSALSSYKILFVNGRTVYLSTTTGIYSAELSSVLSGATTSVECNTLATMTAIYEGDLYAFDGQYVYFYAQLEEVETDDEEEEEADETYYLYRVSAYSTDATSYQLIGQAKSDSRRS